MEQPAGGGESANAIVPFSKQTNQVAPSSIAIPDEDFENGDVKDGPNDKDSDASAEAGLKEDVAVSKDNGCEDGQKDDTKLCHLYGPGFADRILTFPTFLSKEQAAFARSTAPHSTKAFKFDPPTFNYGSTTLQASNKEPPAAAGGTRNPSPDQDAYIEPTHLLGVKWSKRDVECLVECSKRWLCNTKRLKVQDDRTKDDSSDETAQVTSSSDQVDS
ncbi:hypothetical protein HJC23_012915 [Cyclotella cryptica]|uniref:Uncharacterized protein n=1 Tax=Cyclotella cryptica TaxID=29204 RepID=A0ABD3Q1Q9_9STRA|eukprot:CCRYP_009246-RA/>CCRYP_009246-RA protein AED:0.38 eAED:0.38 QI:0/-1/0/1/-1/1/1/0/216